MFYTVFSTNDNPYMQWQSDLLEYSWKQVGQEGELVRLVATDDPENLPSQKHARCFATQSWDVYPETGDAYPIYNKPASLLEWVFREQPEGTVLLLDPDCVFREPVTRRVAPGFPAAQAWAGFPIGEPSMQNPFGIGAGFSFLTEHCAKVDLGIRPVMIPKLIHTRDLKRICGRWLELTGIVRDRFRDPAGNQIWEADMYAYIAACAEYDLQHDPVSLGACTNWDPLEAPDAPIIHYCQPIVGKDGATLFSKHRYEPWHLIDTSIEPEHEFGADLISIINDYVYERAGTVRPLSDQDRPKRAEGIMEGRVLDEMLLERPQDGASLWMNSSGIAIWELCDGSLNVGEIGTKLSEEFDLTEEELAPDILAAIHRLREIGFLSLSG
ncbi:PqqD family protein [Oricola sp.]|uniref:PqqD family protein n=1 Tax=Oricola sp. TaxID=1979950 RepID=UPI003BABA484